MVSKIAMFTSVLALVATACGGTTTKTAQDPSTTSVTSGSANSGKADKKPAVPEAKQDEDDGESLRN